MPGSVASGACIWGFHATVTNGQVVVGWLPPRGHSAEITDSLPAPPPRQGIPAEDMYLLVLKHQHEGQASGLAHN